MCPPRTLWLLIAMSLLAALIFGRYSVATADYPPNSQLPSPVIEASPIDGLKASDLRDSFDEIHFGHRHEAIDLMKPSGTPIHAVVDGTIRKLFVSRMGGNTIYQFDSSRSFCYFYAHLDRYADGLREGMSVEHGQVLGYVGTTGDAAPDAPQLHLAIMRVESDRRWWRGTPIDPYPALFYYLKESVDGDARDSVHGYQRYYFGR